MLSDPLTVKSLDLSAASAITVSSTDSFATIDAGAGRSTRVCASHGAFDGMPAKLTIAHAVSNENKPIKTDRVLIRLDVTGNSATDGNGTGIGRDVTGYAYIIVGVPRTFIGTDTTITGLSMVEALVGAIGVNPSAATLSDANLLRILNGEP